MATSVRSRFRQGFLFACIVLGVVSAAWGGQFRVQFTGEVLRSDFPTIGVGSPVTGFYTYDDAVVPWLENPNIAHYSERVTGGLSFVDGSVRVTDGEIVVFNNSGTLGTYDGYAVYLNVVPGGGTWTGAFASLDHSYDWMVAAIILHSDATGTSWDSIALPDPAVFNPVAGGLRSIESLAGDHRNIDFTITDLSVVPVPVPGALALGAIGLGCCRRLLRRRTT